MTRPVSLREAPVAVWEWWVKSGLPFHFHEPGDRARRFDSPPPLNVCEWLLRNGQLPMWKLPEWITKIGYSAQDDSFLSWLDAHDLIQPLLETMQEQHWPMHTNDSSSLTWTSLLWWMDKVGPRFKDLLQQIPLSFTNTLMLDYIWKACGKGNSISLDGDRLSLWNGHRALEWGLAAGVSIHQKFAFKNATSGAQDNSCLETLEWWCKNRVLIQPAIPKARSVAKLCRGNEEVWAWWERSGLLSDIADVANELDDIFMTEEPSEDSELDD